VNRRFEPLSKVMADPVSMLHCACFPEDSWNSLAVAEVMNITGFFGQIAWVDEMPAGFALALDLHEECEILALGVVPSHRREGIGSALLASVCSEARVRGAERIVLEVAVDNNAALSLYSGRGFIPVGHRRNYYCQAGLHRDALVLRRGLADVTIQP
jgi:[ribosomal protein S18]-alanine N-acetyltransferase